MRAGTVSQNFCCPLSLGPAFFFPFPASSIFCLLSAMNAAIRFKLSAMMFLEFFIWGAWLPLIFGYLPSLGFSSFQSGLILNAFALASFTAMFFSTQFADRNFAAEKFLAVSQVIGGVGIMLLGLAQDFSAVFVV